MAYHYHLTCLNLPNHNVPQKMFQLDEHVFDKTVRVYCPYTPHTMKASNGTTRR